MLEDLFYLPLGPDQDRRILVHAHLPNHKCDTAFLFLSPLLDENKRVQKFEAETARALCHENYAVFRFDYYGTGDSYGETYEFDLLDTMSDIEVVLLFIKETYSIKNINLLGTRLGADLCILIARDNASIQSLFLIEPVIRGSRYMLEQRLRRKSFQTLHNMLDQELLVIIDNLAYEDYQGYLLNNTTIDFIDKITPEVIGLANKYITLFKVDAIFSQKLFKEILDTLENKNQVSIVKVACKDFWASMEISSTSLLTTSILETVKSHAKFF